ncbi:MAG: hypothetical protein KDB80_07555, partial [Planctomycetes bacterium]|nr:hypothetical protein [Planctomycetota bacterium]
GALSFRDAWKRVGDVFKNVAADILRALSQIATRQAALQIVGALFSGFGGSGKNAADSAYNAANIGAGADPTGAIGGARVASAVAGSGPAASTGSSGDSFYFNVSIGFLDTTGADQWLVNRSGAVGDAFMREFGRNNQLRQLVRGSAGGV